MSSIEDKKENTPKRSAKGTKPPTETPQPEKVKEAKAT